MASIDKIYGTYEQHLEFKAWCTEHYPAALKHFYTWENEWLTDGLEHPITNFPPHVDCWMIVNCPFPWVVDRIREQYNGDPNVYRS